MDALGGYDGFITNDTRILSLPTEMVALSQTKIALVMTSGTASHALRAIGLLMVHLPTIAKRLTAARPTLWLLKAEALQPPRLDAQIAKLASSKFIPPEQLIKHELERIAQHRRSP
ncbi:MAG: hypothetical protein EPO26_13970 [Chloroflexota bacterium]|nr:MAG: hypothetical protein EPO26_13970 [Chloroflexota bacterium]